MVGMPDVAVRESRERIKRIDQLRLRLSQQTHHINLAPANVREGGFHLPVALGILGAMGR